MARPQSIEDEALLERLTRVFREHGYEGASLALLSEASGLKRASLYHRFPGGKEQMAREVLAATVAWYSSHIIRPLQGPGSPRSRIAAVAEKLDAFYSGGRQACLLNLLASPHAGSGPLAAGIRSAFEAVIASFATVARDGGQAAPEAQVRAERAVMLLHGSLILSRGLGSGEPFRRFLAGLADDLVGR
jgi:AcrR family transcriptional regulator